jgi:hypothetical protein
MFGRTNTDAVKANVASGKELAAALARDRKFRKHLISALGHGEAARRRVAEQITMKAMLMRLAADEELRRDLVTATKSLQEAWSRVEKKRSHRLRNTLFVVAGAVAVAGVIQSRGRLQEQASKLRRSGASTDEKAEPAAPLTAVEA